MKRWYFNDSWAWSTGTWGSTTRPTPTRVFSEMKQFDDYGILDATTHLATAYPRNTDRSFVWNGGMWVQEWFWAGDMPRGAEALPAPDEEPPGVPWWLIAVPLVVVGAIFYDVVGPRRWT